MATLSVVCTSPECETRLRAFVGECRGKIDQVTSYPAGPQYDVALPDDKVQIFFARLVTAGGYRWKQPA